jgi:hypothetical protein
MTQNFGERRWRMRSCAAADRTGHAMLHTLYQRNVRANTQFFVEWMALDLIRDAEGAVLGVVALEMETGEVDRSLQRQVPRCSPPAVLAAYPRQHQRVHQHRRRHRHGRARRHAAARTWSSGSSIRPALPARAV